MSSQEKNIIAVDSLPSDVLHGATYSIEQANPTALPMAFLSTPASSYPKYQDGLSRNTLVMKATSMTRFPAVEPHYWKVF